MMLLISEREIKNQEILAAKKSKEETRKKKRVDKKVQKKKDEEKAEAEKKKEEEDRIEKMRKAEIHTAVNTQLGKLVDTLYAHMSNISKFNDLLQKKMQERLATLKQDRTRNLASLREFLKNLRQHNSYLEEDEFKYTKVIDLLRWLNS